MLLDLCILEFLLGTVSLLYTLRRNLELHNKLQVIVILTTTSQDLTIFGPKKPVLQTPGWLGSNFFLNLKFLESLKIRIISI